jgi:hypothetical protein
MNGTRSNTQEYVREGNIARDYHAPQEHHWECPDCRQKFTTNVGRRTHLLEHYEASLAARPIVKYYVTMAHLPEFLAESKQEIWKGATDVRQGR